MSSFVWMKVLESTPERYDRGIRWLSRGRIDEVYEEIARRTAVPGRRVLDIGCGTGAVSLACARRGAQVLGIDIDAGMLEVARTKQVPPGGSVEWRELGVAELLDAFAENAFGAVVSCLAMSELSPDEQTYALSAARRLLEPGGVLVLADEVMPTGVGGLLHRAISFPLTAATYVMTQTTTRPVRDIAARVRAAGFVNIREERRWGGSFSIIEATKGTGA